MSTPSAISISMHTLAAELEGHARAYRSAARRKQSPEDEEMRREAARVLFGAAKGLLSAASAGRNAKGS